MKVSQQRIEAYLDRLYGYAFNLTNDREYARDLVQTCAVKALTAKKIPIDEPAYRAWLFKILRNAYRDELRKNVGDTISLDQVDDSGNSRLMAGITLSDPMGIPCTERLYSRRPVSPKATRASTPAIRRNTSAVVERDESIPGSELKSPVNASE